jgi:hypothetical protein
MPLPHNAPWSRLLASLLCAGCCFEFSGACAAIAAPSEQVAALPAGASPSVQLTPYFLPAASLSFAYPKGWAVREKPDKDSLVKISRTVANGFGAEFCVSVHDGLTLDAFKKMFDETGPSKLPGYKKLEEKRLSFGQKGLLHGVVEDFSFDGPVTRITQRFVAFVSNDQVYTVSFTCPNSLFNKLNPLCNQVLATMRQERGSGSATRVGAQPSSWALETFHPSSSMPISLSYPAGWKVQETGEKDHPFKIAGQDSKGHPAGFDLHCSDMPPGATVEQMASALEQKCFFDLKNYRRVRQDSTSFGRSSNMQGLYHEVSYEKDGVPTKQMWVFFRGGGDRFCALCLTGMGWSDNEMSLVFHKVLGTIGTSD